MADYETIYTVRVLLADTNTPFLWDDYEIGIALGRYGNNIELSAAWLLEAAANDAAKVALIWKDADAMEDPSKIAASLIQRAKDIRAIAQVRPAIASPDPVFAMTTDAGLTLGNMGGKLW